MSCSLTTDCWASEARFVDAESAVIGQETRPMLDYRETKKWESEWLRRSSSLDNLVSTPLPMTAKSWVARPWNGHVSAGPTTMTSLFPAHISAAYHELKSPPLSSSSLVPCDRNCSRRWSENVYTLVLFLVSSPPLHHSVRPRGVELFGAVDGFSSAATQDVENLLRRGWTHSPVVTNHHNLFSIW